MVAQIKFYYLIQLKLRAKQTYLNIIVSGSVFGVVNALNTHFCASGQVEVVLTYKSLINGMHLRAGVE